MSVQHQDPPTIKAHHLRSINRALDAYQQDKAQGITGAGWRVSFALGNYQTCEQLVEIGVFEGAIENDRRPWRKRRYRIARSYMESMS